MKMHFVPRPGTPSLSRTVTGFGHMTLERGGRYVALRTIYDKRAPNVAVAMVVDERDGAVVGTATFRGVRAREDAQGACAAFNDAMERNGGRW